ncbi:MAG: heparinase II/III family protein, partial [Notoacmeibacter sp.]
MPRPISPAQEGLLIARLALTKAGRKLRHGLSVLPELAAGLGKRAPSRIDTVLPDIRPADAFIAEQIYSGVFPLVGRNLNTEGHSPFVLKMPSPRFARELHSFKWLRHLRASGTDLASANARSLVTQWLDSQSKIDADLVWADDVAPRRLIAFLQHSTLILQGADAVFYRRFLKTLALHIRHIRASIPNMILSETKLRASISITYARIALPSGDASVMRALRRLTAEIEKDVFSDGGHVSRNPEVMLELLADLVPIRMILAAEGIEAPAGFSSAIDRMFTALRFFRHCDGEAALFNGVGAVVPDRLSSLFRHDDTGNAAPLRLAQSGFERLMMGGTIIIADTGKVPIARENPAAHAGTLAFEMSSGRHRYIVNAGVDTLGPDAYQQISRQTVA